MGWYSTLAFPCFLLKGMDMLLPPIGSLSYLKLNRNDMRVASIYLNPLLKKGIVYFTKKNHKTTPSPTHIVDMCCLLICTFINSLRMYLPDRMWQILQDATERMSEVVTWEKTMRFKVASQRNTECVRSNPDALLDSSKYILEGGSVTEWGVQREVITHVLFCLQQWSLEHGSYLWW